MTEKQPDPSPRAAPDRSEITTELLLDQQQKLGDQLRWMIGIRLVAITSVVMPYFLLQLTDKTTAGFDFLYLLAGVTYLASLFYIMLLRVLRRRAEVHAYIQFCGDLLLISGLVYYFGGVASPFSILYFIVIIVSSTLLQRRAGLTVGTMAWLMYAAVVVSLYYEWITAPQGSPPEMVSHWRLAYSLVIHFIGFWVVAMLTSRLAQSVTRYQRELQTQRGDLADLQVVHRDVIESIPSGLITCDLEGRITSANGTALEILGLHESRVLGRQIYQIGLHDRRQWDELLLSSNRHDRTRRELTYRHGDSLRHIGYSLTPLTGADGTPSGHVLIFQDLSDWRKLQEEVRIKDRMAAVGELAAGIAHEIGNPLAALSGSAQMLAAGLPPDSDRGELLEIILKESQRLDRTIKSFLKFARPKERASVRFDIAQLLSENLQLLRHSQEVSDGHRLDLKLDPPSANIIGDPDQISQIFWNLARNALKAMPDGGALTVEGTLSDDRYRIRFIDTGRGMSAEERTNMFHPFQSFFDSGTGIGMAIVYRIVQQHQGHLTVDSRRGAGTTVTVELPAKEATMTAVREQE